MPLMPMPPIPMKCACWEVANILDAKVKGTIRACRRGSLADAAKVPLKLKEGMRTEEKHAGRTVETTGNEVEVKRRSTTRTEPKSCAFLFSAERGCRPQPFELAVFTHDISGEGLRQQEPSLNNTTGRAGRKSARVGWDGGVMKNVCKWMLGAAVVAGGLGLGATAVAQSAEFGVYARGPVAYVPPCPGPGYAWVAGYQSDGYWIPGRWNFIGVRGGEHFAGYYGDRDDYRHEYREHEYREHERGWRPGSRLGRRHDRGDRDHYRR